MEPLEDNMNKQQPPGADNQGTGSDYGWLRRGLYVVAILAFLMVAATGYTIWRGLNVANDAIVQPIGDLVQNLGVPATPVILPDSAVVVRQINNLARLETVSMEFTEVVSAERIQPVLGFDVELESMVFVGVGTVVAGVDFSKMAVADLQVVDPDTVRVRLPEAEIFEDLPVLDTEASYVADRDTMFLIEADAELETQMRQEAEARIRESATSSDILDRADVNAQAYMLNFLNGLGFEDVQFFSETPPTAEPFSQELPKGFILTTPTPTAVP